MAPEVIGIGRHQFPSELVLMIPERFCWRDVLALEEDVLLQETMLTKLNHNHPVIADCLNALDNYHEGLHRLTKINLVTVGDVAELQFLGVPATLSQRATSSWSRGVVLDSLKEICESFPGLKRFELEVGNETRLSFSVKKFLKKSVNSWSIIRRPRDEDD